MNEPLPSVTVLIAARPQQAEIKAVRAARALDYPAAKMEILVARGKQPSVQRNAALRAAKGDLIYFLDDDSVPSPYNLKLGIRHFVYPKVKMVGGPNLCPPDAPALERIFSLVLASWLAFGPSRARYTPVGEVRATSEKELILCNMLARRETLLELEGFNEKLYPNEENALMDEVQKRGGTLIYDPQFTVERRPRANLLSFMKMLMTYGRGRAEQFRVHPTFGSVLNFAPPAFVLYLALLLIFRGLSNFITMPPILHWMAMTPLIAYVIAIAAQVRVLAREGGWDYSLGAVPLIMLTHILYGYGFWRGLFTTLKAPDGSGGTPPIDVVLENVRV